MESRRAADTSAEQDDFLHAYAAQPLFLAGRIDGSNDYHAVRGCICMHEPQGYNFRGQPCLTTEPPPSVVRRKFSLTYTCATTKSETRAHAFSGWLSQQADMQTGASFRSTCHSTTSGMPVLRTSQRYHPAQQVCTPQMTAEGVSLLFFCHPQGLRFNRTLLFLSLSNNQIGDSGATELAMVLGEIVLTHEEIVERRKLLLEKMYCAKLRSRFMSKAFRQAKSHPQWLTEEEKLASLSSSAADVDQSSVAKLSTDHLPSAASATLLSSGKGESKSTAKKRESSKPEGKRAPGKDQRCSKKDGQDIDERGQATDPEHRKSLEMANMLVSDSLEQRNGDLILPGNTSLVSLNLAGNRITELSLPQFLSSLQMQDTGKGLLRLCLQRNHFAAECEPYVKIQELMALRDPLNKKSEEEEEEEGEESHCSDSETKAEK
ncbi:leucine-rich repeat-containing protein 71 isoform X3 [Dunckerocampus dactyliophorus]|nr:leucine-rich repeat-containing protein 71 isoform X3 [Dunckerocampus dactyliophorus]